MIMLPAITHCSLSTYSNYIKITSAQLSICLDGASEVYIMLILITRHNINYIVKSQSQVIAEK